MSSSARWLVTSFIVILALVAVCTAVAVLLLWHAWRASETQNGGKSPPIAQQSATAASVQADPSSLPTDANDPAGLPTCARRLQVLAKAHFTIGYDPELREPAWVSYALAGPIRNHGHEKRPDRFASDPAIGDSPRHEDYSRSGYDRGHMCPAYAEFSRFGPEGMSATFVTTNICPQIHGLNAGRWEDLEAMIAGREHEHEARHHARKDKAEEEEGLAEDPQPPGPSEAAARVMAAGGWACEYGEVYVTDGPVVPSDARRLRAGEAIPSAFFMILLRQEKGGHWRSLAFEMPNEPVTEPLEHFLVPIARIERETGLTFVGALPADQQEALTGEVARALW
jgi:endonuclease G